MSESASEQEMGLPPYYHMNWLKLSLPEFKRYLELNAKSASSGGKGLSIADRVELGLLTTKANMPLDEAAYRAKQFKIAAARFGNDSSGKFERSDQELFENFELLVTNSAMTMYAQNHALLTAGRAGFMTDEQKSGIESIFQLWAKGPDFVEDWIRQTFFEGLK